MITSKSHNSPYSLKIAEADFSHSELPAESYTRCNRLFEASDSIILKKAAAVTAELTRRVIETLILFLQS